MLKNKFCIPKIYSLIIISRLVLVVVVVVIIIISYEESCSETEQNNYNNDYVLCDDNMLIFCACMSVCELCMKYIRQTHMPMDTWFAYVIASKSGSSR